jgi:hypothetical protein
MVTEPSRFQPTLSLLAPASMWPALPVLEILNPVSAGWDKGYGLGVGETGQPGKWGGLGWVGKEGQTSSEGNHH